MMYLFNIITAVFAALAAARPIENCETPSVYLAGDSTMALGGGGGSTQGWGEYLKYSLNIPVINEARAGRSARSYSYEGRFAQILSTVKAGDFVVIEFGHNDGGSLNATTDNGRTDCPGAGSETCDTDLQKGILTYPGYLKNATDRFTELGAYVVLSGNTPDNPWETGSFVYSAPRFAGYSQSTAALFSHAAYVDHGTYVANIFESLGAKTVDAYFPMDHTHTSPVGANVVAAAYVKGLLCGGSPLAAHVKNSTSAVAGNCV